MKQTTLENEDKLLSTLVALQYYKDRKPKSEQVNVMFKKYF